MTRRGALIVVSGPSGSGKSTVCDHLRKTFPGLAFSVSATTRARRGHEVDGVDYHFLPRERFDELVAQGGFAEWAEVHGNRYGTPKSTVEEARAAGRDLLLDVDVQGGLSIRAAFPDATLVFLAPPSLDVLRERLTARGTDAPEVIDRRIANAALEMERGRAYDHYLVNDRLDETLGRAETIVRGRVAPPAA